PARKRLPEPEGSIAMRVVVDRRHQLVAPARVETWRLAGVGEEHDLGATTSGRLVLGRLQKFRTQSRSPQSLVHPQVLQFAAAAPGPAVDTGLQHLTVADEDRQLGRTRSAGDRERRFCQAGFELSEGFSIGAVLNSALQTA